MTADGKPKDALCLCEYDDIDGQRQHIMAMCCDCDALDVACDRCSIRSYTLVLFITDLVIIIVVSE